MEPRRRSARNLEVPTAARRSARIKELMVAPHLEVPMAAPHLEVGLAGPAPMAAPHLEVGLAGPAPMAAPHLEVGLAGPAFQDKKGRTRGRRPRHYPPLPHQDHQEAALPPFQGAVLPHHPPFQGADHQAGPAPMAAPHLEVGLAGPAFQDKKGRTRGRRPRRYPPLPHQDHQEAVLPPFQGAVLPHHPPFQGADHQEAPPLPHHFPLLDLSDLELFGEPFSGSPLELLFKEDGENLDVTEGDVGPGVGTNEGQNEEGVASGTVASGIVASGIVASGTVASGIVASGIVASGTVASGIVASGIVASGTVASGEIGEEGVASGTVASGIVASGIVASWEIGCSSSTQPIGSSLLPIQPKIGSSLLPLLPVQEVDSLRRRSAPERGG